MKNPSKIALAAALAASALTLPAHATPQACIDSDTGTQAINLGPTDGLDATGNYALPAAAPKALVVYAHGYSHNSTSWLHHMERTANDHGAIAVAMDYRGTYKDAKGNVRGWFVNEGAVDSIAAAKHFLAACGENLPVILYGVSMGGNTSGLAIAADAKRADGVTPLFDYWVAGEPAVNATETYLEASAVAPANDFAGLARDDIEDEYNGKPTDNPTGYRNGTVVARIADIVASGVKGVAIVHGIDDGLVPHNQARELQAELLANGIPTDFYTATFRESGGTDCGTDNTTLTENALGQKGMEDAIGKCYSEPLAGHSTESSDTSLVEQTGLEVVFKLVDGSGGIPANNQFFVDGNRRNLVSP